LFDAKDGGDHSKNYEKLLQNTCDVAVGYKTDPQVVDPGSEYRVLDDDLHHFGKYYAFPLYSQKSVEKFQGLQNSLKRLAGLIDDRAINTLLNEARSIGLNEESLNPPDERANR